MQVTGQVNTLADEEQQGHAQAAEDLEVHPPLLKGKGHEQVSATGYQEKHDPGLIQSDPDRLWQADCVAQHALDQRLVTDEVAGQKGNGENPVDHRSLPFEEGFTVERQRHPAKQQAGRQSQPLALLQATLYGEKSTIDQHRTADQYRGGAEDAADHEALIGKFDGAWIQLVDDEKQDKRDEIDELFHGASHALDETA